ncbi:MAG: tRNA (guanosine(46)-N7)-methyltransferase TrmB [Bacteroidota bacterium]
MAKRKLERFAENSTFPHLFQPTFDALQNGFNQQGKWHEFFGNHNPVILELGCGKGEYTVTLAGRHPENNYIGIDIKGARIWRGAKTSIESKFENVAFLRMRIDMILKAFEPGEVSGIWITFPDPQPAKARKRLTSPMFLDRYKQILQSDSIIHLKTDNAGFFEYTLETIASEGHQLLMHTFDLYNSNLSEDVMLTQTHYEKIFLSQGIPIKYLRFKLK